MHLKPLLDLINFFQSSAKSYITELLTRLEMKDTLYVSDLDRILEAEEMTFLLRPELSILVEKVYTYRDNIYKKEMRLKIMDLDLDDVVDKIKENDKV